MNKVSSIIISFLLTAGWFGIAYAPGLAQTPTPTPPVPQITPAVIQLPTPFEGGDNPENNVSLAVLQTLQTGAPQIKPLQGPLDSLRFSFSLPPDWKLMPGGRLILSGRVIISSLVATQGNLNFENLTAGQISVTLDDQDVHAEILKGDQAFSLDIGLPETFFDSANPASHELGILWDAQASCGYNVATSLLIDSSSHLVLPHQAKALGMDLSVFSQPLYIEKGIQNPSIVLVIPDDAVQAHLQSALTVAAGLGRLSSGHAHVSLAAESELSDDAKKADHLVYIGLVSDFKNIDSALMGDLDTSGALPSGSGFVRMLPSPGNPARILLFVSGENQDGILKAAQAVSMGVLSPTVREDTAVIETIHIPEPAKAYTEDVTFARLKVPEKTFTNFGSNIIEIPFTVPLGTAIGSESYLDLVFGHSQMLDYIRSGLVIRLNGTPIGSARFSDSTAVGSTLRTMLPSSVLRGGINLIEVQADLFPRDICTDERLKNLFIVVYSNSLLHLPAVNQTPEISNISYLDAFPEPYIDDATLSDTAFILPERAVGAWRIAAQLAFDLGKRTSAPVSAPTVYLANAVPDDILKTHHAILVGKPSALPFLPSWKGVLPAAFGADDSPSGEIDLPVSFQNSPDAQWGYLISGNSAGKAIFGVLGNGDEGIAAAYDILGEKGAHAKLGQGNFAVTQRRSLLVAELQPAPLAPAGGEGQPAEGGGVAPPAAGAQPEQALPADYNAPELWILPVMILSLVLIILICGWQIRNALRKR